MEFESRCDAVHVGKFYFVVFWRENEKSKHEPADRTVVRRLMTPSGALRPFDSRHRTSRDVTGHVSRLDHVA
jgi:hypothetical protein